jgi:ABC-type lipoprotein export system ATPase subunit
MDIDNHYNFLLNNYKLNYFNYKYIFIGILTSAVREMFYWMLLYFSDIVKEQPESVPKYAGILIGLLGINIPISRYYNKVRSDLIKNVKMANSSYFNNKIINMSKSEMLNFDLVEYFNILDHFNENLEQYINNIKTKFDIPIRLITLFIIAFNKRFTILVGLFAVFYSIVRSLHENKLVIENKLTTQFFAHEEEIRNYIINGKNFLINDEFNKEYLTELLNKFENTNKEILELNNSLDMKINFLMFSFIIIVILLRLKHLNHFDFFYYFLIVYDIEFVSDKLNEYYKNKNNEDKMKERLNFLNSFIIETIKPNKTPIEQIVINKIYNKAPKLITQNPITINKNDHILVDGKSGSGKTSFLYLFKGIVKASEFDIGSLDINALYSQSFLTLPNHKSMYSGNLYDIITNYQKDPDISLIEESLKIAKLYDKLNKNQFVNIEKLSSGERIRLLISRIIYTVKLNNYSILLFDEIDENLNDEMAFEIVSALRNVFRDKIILYITHNDTIKELFKKRIEVDNGVIKFNPEN